MGVSKYAFGCWHLSCLTSQLDLITYMSRGGLGAEELFVLIVSANLEGPEFDEEDEEEEEKANRGLIWSRTKD